ncbi:MAG: thioredoxin family protein, partial [Pseudomonadota bacterium]
PDTDGVVRSSADLMGPNGLLVVFICNHCPFVKTITPKLARDGRAILDLGVGMVAINSNDADSYPQDGFDKMGPFAAEAGFPFAYLHDADQTVARAFGAVCTPDFFGYTPQGLLQFRGRLDGSGMTGEDMPSELVPAMAHLAETGHGPQVQHPSMGCSIKWKAA